MRRGPSPLAMFGAAATSTPVRVGSATHLELQRHAPIKHPRAFLAASLATSFSPTGWAGPDEDPVARLERTALRTKDALSDRRAAREERRVEAYGETLLVRARGLAPGVSVRVIVGLVHELLGDAPDTCVDLDRDLRRASKAHGVMVTPEAWPLVKEILADVDLWLEAAAR